jgi:hypothetical protein
MTQESHPQENAKMAIDTALLVFYLTALAYIAAFSYEAGYLYHFGLWLDFVEVDLKQLLVAFGVMSAFVGAVWTGSDAVTHMWSQLVARKVWGRLLSRVITVAFIIFAAWLTEQHWYFTLAMLFPVLLNLFFQFVAPIWVPDHGTYTERIERWMEHGDELEGKGLRVADCSLARRLLANGTAACVQGRRSRPPGSATVAAAGSMHPTRVACVALGVWHRPGFTTFSSVSTTNCRIRGVSSSWVALERDCHVTLSRFVTHCQIFIYV